MEGIPNTFDLDGNFATMQTFFFDSDFLGATNITWGGNAGAQFDNIKIDVSNVPVPTAVWLFGSGFIGLIGMKKKPSKVTTLSA